MAALTADPAEILAADDPLAFEDGWRYEFVDGELVERPMSYDSSLIGGEFYSEIRNHARPGKLGDALPSDLGMRLWPQEPNRTRKADAAFIAAERAPQGNPAYLRVPPDLVVEVISPTNLALDIRAKVDEWIEAGVRMVWVVYPEQREVYVYRKDGHPSVCTADDELSGEDVLPGFARKAASLFPER